MNKPSKENIEEGQRIYTKSTLNIYDLLVTHFSNKFIWRCPKRNLLDQYNEFMKGNHLDIGVGTGYYLRKAKKNKVTHITLMDLNDHCLQKCFNAIDFNHIDTKVGDVFDMHEELDSSFDSVGINYLLHCLPGNEESKHQVIENVVRTLKKDGVLFGSTIISDKAYHTRASTKLMAFYNAKHIFFNANDTIERLEKSLSKYLRQYEIIVKGCVAVFHGIK